MWRSAWCCWRNSGRASPPAACRCGSLVNPFNLADLVAILSLLLAPLLQGAMAFLRVLRTLRLLHSVKLITTLRSDLPFFRRNEEATLAAAQLLVFLFVMSGVVFETQHRANHGIGNYADALYFTVTTLTTTGFGDVTLPGTPGPAAVGGHHAGRRHPVPAAGPGIVPPDEGALPLSRLRAGTARAGCRALQGLRPIDQHPG